MVVMIEWDGRVAVPWYKNTRRTQHTQTHPPLVVTLVPVVRPKLLLHVMLSVCVCRVDAIGESI